MTSRNFVFAACLTSVALGAMAVCAGEHPLAGTVLKKLADGMEPGTFLRLHGGPHDPALPEGFDSYSRVQMKGTFHSSAELWAPVAEWCPLVRRVYQVLDRTGGPLDYDRTAISGYDAASHAWIRHNLHPESGERKILGGPHVYGGWAVASRHGKLYRPRGNTMWEYDLREETWSSREFPGFGVPGQTPVVFHADLDRLVCISRNGEVRAWDPVENTVETLPGGNPAQSGRHGQAVYNATRREVMFWAGDRVGDHARRQITLVQSNRTVVVKNPTPENIYEKGRNSELFLSYDPVSGNYLTFELRTKELWEYNPDLDEWRFAIELRRGDDRFPPYHGHLMTPIPEAGIIMWNHRASPRLYKHQSVFGTKE